MQSRPSSQEHRALLIAAVVISLLSLLAIQQSAIGNPQSALSVNLDALRGVGGVQAQLVDAYRTQNQSPSQAFDALNRRAGGTLDAMWDAQTGIPRFLAGNGGSVRIPYEPTAAERGNPLAIARGFLDENRALFRLDSVAADFGPGRIEPDLQLSFSHIRMPQVYKGIPVYGRQLIVHLDAKEQVVAVSGQYVPAIAVATQPTLTKEQAEEVAMADLRENRLNAQERASVKVNLLADRTALMVYVDDQGRATLTWNVQMLTESPLGEWNVFVNARRPVVTHAISEVDTAMRRQTYTARNSTDIPGRLLIDEGERSSDPIAQAAQDNAGKVYGYYFNTFKRDGVDGQGSPMVSTVHYGSSAEDAENAAWISEANQMVYGDGGQIFKPLAYGLDVVGHEFTHGVTDSTAQLVYEGQSGALNESYSDVFGAMIDRANWTMGETIIKSPPYPIPYLRSLQDPEANGNYDPNDPLRGVGQPGDMSKYANLPNDRNNDNGGVHINSGIPSHAAYFVAQALGKDKMEQIYYRTLTQYLSPSANFADAGRASMQAATDLYGPTAASAVQTAFRQVGVNIGGGTTGPGSTLPSPTSGPAPRPSATPAPGQPAPPLPAGCRELIVNGGFEGGTGWKEVSSSHTSIIDTQLPHSGSQSAWLGGTDKESVQYIYQDVQLPANATSVKLTYYRLVHQQFSGLGSLFAANAQFKAVLADAQGNQLTSIEVVSSANADDQWHQAQFDLGRYAGQTVRLVYTAANPRGNISSMFVDDVSMSSCTTGQAPSAPPASGNQVYVHGYITDADTGRGIPGAQIFILKPGVSASSAAADGQVTDNEVLTYATTDNQGLFQTPDPVAKGTTYSAIVIANGYRPIVADNGVNISSSASNPAEVDASMRSGQ